MYVGERMTMSLSREAIKLMMQSQRMIKKEFGVRIDLDNEQAIAMFIAYASQSSSGELKECSNRLMALLIPDGNSAAEETPAKSRSQVRYYRGQPVTIPEENSVNQDKYKQESNHTKQITYRGQKVIC